MRIHFKIIAILILLIIHLDLSAQLIAPVLKTGKWYKFSVGTDGIFKVDYDLLKKTGINPDQVDPRKIRIFAGFNGMLPQANSASRLSGLSELAIFVDGEQDGKFNKEDFILFFGQSSDIIQPVVSKSIFSYQNNIYSDKNFYFLTVSDQPGKRLNKSESLPGSFPVINQFDDFSLYESDKYNVLSSGREWFGEQFDTSPEVRIRFDMPDIVENSAIKIVSHVMSQSQEETSFKLFFNNIEIGQQKISPIPNSQYGIKGRKAMDTLTVLSNAVNAPSQNSFEIKYQYTKGATTRSIGYLDFITINTIRKLKWTNTLLPFLSMESLKNAISTFEINTLPQTAFVWDVTDPFEVKEQTFTFASDKSSFSVSTAIVRKFIAFTSQNVLTPDFEGGIENQDLRDLPVPDLLIVTHPIFKDEALRLAAHRKSHSKLSVQVVTTDEVYNEYAGGKQDITAIRDFARSLYSRSTTLKNLLLFGRCSYDYKDRVVSNSNYVPTYQSKNSLSPLETYSSDDFFGFFELNEGTWNESPAENHTMEIGVGRLSVKKVEEAVNIVDKLITYDLNEKAVGKWRKDILFVADDGDFNIHQSQAEQMANEVELNHPEFNTSKIFVDAYKQLERPSGQYSPDATDALNRAVNKGSLIVNFTGHGSEQVWVQEKILDPSSINEWKNKYQFPLFVTATCEFGRHDDPLLISTGELILTKKNAGAIGLVTTARPVNSSTNFILNKAFYNSLFQKQDGKYKDLGTIFRDTKNQSLSGVANRNFSLLGDPSMHLAIPENEILIDEIKTASGSDTLKALSDVVIKGKVVDGSNNLIDFSGTLHSTLYDKVSSNKTLGDENPVFTYKAFDHILYQGKASVLNGTFELKTIIPKNIATEVGEGKLSLYASDNNFTIDANGASNDFKIGKSEPVANTDTKGPDIILFLGDTTYQVGGVVGADTQLVATLFDEHGINISGYPGGDITIKLDDSISYIANQYYESFADDFKSGMLSFPISNLAKGNHTLTLTASDTYLNSSTASIEFSVSESNKLIIDALVTYPNPFYDKTTIEFSHNRPGEDLEAQMVIYNSLGQPVNFTNYTVSDTFYKVTLGEWDGTANGSKLTSGIYFLKLAVRSLADGAKNEKLTKLIVLN